MRCPSALPLVSLLLLLGGCAGGGTGGSSAGPQPQAVAAPPEPRSAPASLVADVANPCREGLSELTGWRLGAVEGERLTALARACQQRGSDPRLGQALLGYGLEQLGEPRQGLQELNALLSFSDGVDAGSDTRLVAYWARSYFYGAWGRYGAAAEDLTAAIGLRSQSGLVPRASLFARRGFFQRLADQGAASERSFESARNEAQTREEQVDVLRDNGLVRLMIGDWEEAARLLGQLVSVPADPYFRAEAIAYAFLADCQVNLFAGRGTGPAVSQLRQRYNAVSLPDYPGIYARLYLGEVGPEEALAVAQANTRQNEQANLAEAFYHVGVYHLMRGERDLAETAFGRSISTRVTTRRELMLSQAVLRLLDVAAATPDQLSER